MRRILFGGLSLALGAFASPAAGQDTRANSAQAQPQRVAKLGLPVATSPAPAVDSGSGVTPVGLLRRDPVQAVVPTPMPPPSGASDPPPGTVTGIPTVTEDRSGSSLDNPTVLPGMTFPGATVQPGTPGMYSVVPSVAPDGSMVIPVPPGMEAPSFPDCAAGGPCPPGAPAMERVASCGKWAFSGEYLMWWSRAANVPPLVTTSSPQFNGILGTGNTTTLVGGSFGETFHSGVRVSGVRWFGCDDRNGLEGRMFFLGQASSSFTATTAEYPLLARPFINTNQPVGQFSEVVAAVGRASGGVNVQLENSVWGAEANYRRFLFGNACARVDAIVGYRYLNVTEKLTVTENFINPTGATNIAGMPVVSGSVQDSFRTVNQFNGGQIGLAGELHRGRWSLDGRATVAFGDLNRQVDINGGQVLTLANGRVVTSSGGLLALPGANIGHYSDNIFAVVPEAGVNLGYQISSHLRCFVGYNFLYLGNALRPGDVVDTYVDAARIPNFPLPGNPSPLNTVSPTPQFRSSGFFVQGVSFGLQFTW